MTKEKLKHYVIYFIFGVLTTLVSMVSLWLLVRMFPALNENISNIISIVIAMIFAYFVNRKYVFKSEEVNKFKEFCKFIASRIASAIFEIGFFWLLSKYGPFDFIINKFVYSYLNDDLDLASDLCTMLNKFIVCFFIMIINYVMSRFLVFKDSSTKVKES